MVSSQRAKSDRELEILPVRSSGLTPLIVAGFLIAAGCSPTSSSMETESRWIQYHVLTQTGLPKPFRVAPPECDGQRCQSSWEFGVREADPESKLRLIHAVEARYDCGFRENPVTTCRKATESDIYTVELITEPHSLHLRLGGIPW